MNRKCIMICDDQDRFITKFKEEHNSHYDIKVVNDTSNLIKEIKDLKKLPELLLLDLYHPKDGKKVPFCKEEKANRSLDKLDKQIKKTKLAVLEAWDPLGLDLLKNLRMEFSPEELPIAIYTQKGLSLLDDSQISAVDEFNAHWMLKKRGYRYTKIRIDRIIHEEETSKRIINYYWSFTTLLLVMIGILVSIIFNNYSTKLLYLEILSILLNTLFGHFIQRILECRLRK